MNTGRIIVGFLVSTIGGAIVLWIIMYWFLWPLIDEAHRVRSKSRYTLTIILGILERLMYTAALIFGFPAWIPVWIAVKAAVGWFRREKEFVGQYNIYMIGTLLSLIFGFIGAWIIWGKLPIVR